METNKITADMVINEVNAAGDKLLGAEFPLKHFPKEFQDLVRTASHCQGYPLDFTAGSMMFASAVAVGNTHVVKVKEGWTESGILYLAIVGKAGTNKSHPMSFAMKPLIAHDTAEKRIFNQQYAEYQQLLELSKKERTEHGCDDTLNPPKLKKFVVSDITQEGLAAIHEQNKRGICLYVDELKSWINNFNRYSKGSEEQFWLSNFSGKPIIVDRRSSERGILVERSYISVMGSIQMSRLADLAKGERSDNGFIDRVLFVVPQNLEKKCWSRDELPMHIESRWESILNRLIGLELPLNEFGDPDPIKLSYSEVAKERLYEWQRTNVELCNNELDERLVGVYSKLEIYVSRFALILQMIRWACGVSERVQIETESIEGAIAITEYFRIAAQRVQNMINGSGVDALTELQKRVVTALPNTFTTADGVAVAVGIGLKERTFKDFLNRHVGIIFRRDKHGLYSKIYI
ncbi:MAG: DUF3987 domain-containing protein [Rikenellaceae bacterium]